MKQTPTIHPTKHDSVHSAHAEAVALRHLYLETQARTSDVLLRHGADDAAELRDLARLVGRPAYIVRDDVAEVR